MKLFLKSLLIIILSAPSFVLTQRINATPEVTAPRNNDGPPSSDSSDDWVDDDWGGKASGPTITHRIDISCGGFIHDNHYVQESNSLGEIRYRFDASQYWDDILANFKAELITDGITNDIELNIREALVSFPVSNHLDIRAGRQILTWGTGDLVFLNDLFPKDWQSFFSGRAIEYLKAPSDSIKASYYGNMANFDLVWTPAFNHDEYLTGERFSFYNPLTGQLTGAPPKFTGLEPDEKIRNGELALRVFQTVHSKEWALYTYRGFTKQPLEFDTSAMRPTFARLNVFGASLLSPMAGGLFNTEFAWYDIPDEKDGDNPFIPNSQLRYLIAYEKEVVSKLTLKAQLYVEQTLDYHALIDNSFNPDREVEEYRNLTTLRASYRAMQDKLMLSLFTYYSPSDKDHYFLPQINYRASDQLSMEFGGNLFGGKDRYTFFGQLEDNSNIYARVRWDF